MDNIEFLKKEVDKNNQIFAKIDYKNVKNYIKDLDYIKATKFKYFYDVAHDTNNLVFNLYVSNILLKIEQKEVDSWCLNKVFNEHFPNSSMFKVDMFHDRIRYVFHLMNNLEFNREYSFLSALTKAANHHAFVNMGLILESVPFKDVLRNDDGDSSIYEARFLQKIENKNIYVDIIKKTRDLIFSENDDVKKILGQLVLRVIASENEWFTGYQYIHQLENELKIQTKMFKDIVGDESYGELSMAVNILSSDDKDEFAKMITDGYFYSNLDCLPYGDFVCKHLLMKNLLMKNLSENINGGKAKKLKM